jgi:hypothetical protein
MRFAKRRWIKFALERCFQTEAVVSDYQPKAAKQIGVRIVPELLARANKLIKKFSTLDWGVKA